MEQLTASLRRCCRRCCQRLQTLSAMQGALVQCRRALKPDGLLLAVMFGGDTLHELRVAVAAAEEEVEGGISQRVSPLAQVTRATSGAPAYVWSA